MSIQDRIHGFVVQNFLFGSDGDALRNDESLLEAGIIDSTGVLELLAFIEREYEISVQNNELLPDNFESIEKVARFVDRKLEIKARAATT